MTQKTLMSSMLQAHKEASPVMASDFSVSDAKSFSHKAGCDMDDPCEPIENNNLLPLNDHSSRRPDFLSRTLRKLPASFKRKTSEVWLRVVKDMLFAVGQPIIALVSRVFKTVFLYDPSGWAMITLPAAPRSI